MNLLRFNHKEHREYHMAQDDHINFDFFGGNFEKRESERGNGFVDHMLPRGRESSLFDFLLYRFCDLLLFQPTDESFMSFFVTVPQFLRSQLHKIIPHPLDMHA